MCPASWDAFLRVRAQLIDEFHEEGKTDAEIASVLSMVPIQVYLIRTRPDNVGGYERKRPT